MPPQTDFIAYPSRVRISALILGAAVFICIGAWMAGLVGPVPGDSRHPDWFVILMGWASILFFGLCFAAGVKRLFETDEELRIGSLGIKARRWSDQTIPWPEIADVTTWEYKRTRTIVLHLHNPSLFPGRGAQGKLAGINRRLTGGDIAISMTATDRSVDETLAVIAAYRAA